MISIDSGPFVTTGNTNPAMNADADAGGPSLIFQGTGLIDPRLVQQIGTQPGSEKIQGLFSAAYVPVVDGTPQASSATRIAAAQAVGSGGANLALASTQATGIATNIPLVPFGKPYTIANAVNVLALDYGFTTVNCTGGNATVTIPAGTDKFFYNGQQLWLAGAGSDTSHGMTVTVTGQPSATTITVNPPPVTTNASAQCGTIDLQTGVSVWPYIVGNNGIAQTATLDPTQCISRSWQAVSSGAGDTTQTITVTGYDVYGQLMHETATLNGTTVIWGKRAFKYISQVNVSATTAGNISVGTSDCYGINLLSNAFEYTNVYWNATFQTAATGWVAGLDFLTAATGTNGDVRGTVQLGANQGGTGNYTGVPNGSIRLAIFMNLPQYNILQATNLNSARMFGAAQF